MKLMKSLLVMKVEVYSTHTYTHTHTHTHTHIYIYIYIDIPVALRPNSRTWTPLKGFCDHTQWTHHTRQESSGQVISQTQRSSPDDTQQSQQTKTMLPAGFERTDPAGEWPHTHALDRAAIGIGIFKNGEWPYYQLCKMDKSYLHCVRKHTNTSCLQRVSLLKPMINPVINLSNSFLSIAWIAI